MRKYRTNLRPIQSAKLKEGYANFAVAEPPLKLVLLENPGKGGPINHLDVEVQSSDSVHAEIAASPPRCRRKRWHVTAAPTPQEATNIAALSDTLMQALKR